MSTIADGYRRSVELQALFPIHSFRFIVCNTLLPGQEVAVKNRAHPVLMYILNGCVEIRTDSNTLTLHTGDFCFLEAQSSQIYQNTGTEATHLHLIGFSFSDPAYRCTDFSLPLNGNLNTSPIAIGLFHKLHHCWMEQKIGYPLKVLSLFFQILYHISICTQQEHPSEYHRLQPVVRYLYENCFSRDIGIEDLCRQCNYSPTHLRKLFVKYFQMPPSQYIRHVKLEFAKNLLVLSKKSISQIAGEVGYRDVAHFDRVFKKELGMTPLEYRNNHFINNILE